ncbi:MAG: tRNA preQ1(34) S-adenosylmethionine ribosyltransferase-isomerase QueA [candidate division WOR-3 bacterium]|nr:tRNA preQ1(34) S-adenosylmethionine ribosyltransferase-isomerase QueA [candidate division WOR-3 bacterium]
MRVAEFDYDLPKELIAQSPQDKRDESRLLILNRKTGEIRESIFRQLIDFLYPNDILVINDTKVIPARIYGKITRQMNEQIVELLLLREIEPNKWEVLARPAKLLKPGVEVIFNSAYAKVLERRDTGIRIVEFYETDVKELLQRQGEIALPPYIKSKPKDINRYQTIYAEKEGAIAAPTAGLHFTEELLSDIRAKGIEIAKLTLHCGLGTFRPVKVELVEEHKMHREEFEISEKTAEVINKGKREGRRIIAVGTTVVRSLESQAFVSKDNVFQVKAHKGFTDLYIYPGYKYKIVDAMITNFHLPKSTLLMLVCAFANKEFIFNAYQYAIEHKFRFYSFGDAMFIY